MRHPAARAQKRIRGARQAIAASAADVPELDAELRAALAAVTHLEDRTAQVLGQAPSARDRRES